MFMPDGQGVLIGLLTLTAATLWYAQAEVRWFKQDLAIGGLKAIGAFTLAFLAATVVAFFLAITIGLEAKNLTP